MPRVALLVPVLVLVLAVPARAVMPMPVRLALMLGRTPWTDLRSDGPRPAWQIALDWSRNGSS